MAANIPIRATYIWCSGKDTHHDLRSKDKSLHITEEQAKWEPSQFVSSGLLPEWNFDGSSTGQALGADTEILIRPVAAWNSPFDTKLRRHLLVLAECFTPDGKPTPDNSRFLARQVFEAKKDLKPWYGLEQEFILMKKGRPYGWPENGFPAPQGPYYCGNGKVAYGRDFVDTHYELALKMGLRLSGTNAEVMPGQWEFQVGPCEGIEAGDHLLMARWLMLRLLETGEQSAAPSLDVDFTAKPIKGDWNGSGLHTNFSTTETRDEKNGMAAIKSYIGRLEKNVSKCIPCYGTGNDQRLTGHHETSSYKQFSFGVGTRTTSIRIPNAVNSSGSGYFEDRRPAGNADPYLVTARLFAAACEIPSPALDARTEQLREPWMQF